MKIQYCSDLHLEIRENSRWIKHNPLKPVGDILIIAGDLFYLGSDYGRHPFFRFCSDHFQETYIIPGNHEYYSGFDISTAEESSCEEVQPNVFLVNNYSIQKGEVQFVFSTMWTELVHHIPAILNGMADFHRIQYQGEYLNEVSYNRIHRKSFDFIKKAVENSSRNIVVTHHLPSPACNSPEFAGGLLNDGFCVDKSSFISEAPIEYWIYGHSHRNMPLIDIGGCKLINNQLGYVAWNEHLDFDPGRVLEIAV